MYAKQNLCMKKQKICMKNKIYVYKLNTQNERKTKKLSMKKYKYDKNGFVNVTFMPP